MTYYADLGPITYLGTARGGDTIAIGWLEADHAYTRGEVKPEVVAALETLFQHAWQPVTASGWHDCSLCGRQLTDGPIAREIGGRRDILGVKNLLVPAGDKIYIAPSLIIHYIEDHGYEPPAEFVKALLALDPSVEQYPAQCERLWYGVRNTEQ